MCVVFMCVYVCPCMFTSMHVLYHMFDWHIWSFCMFVCFVVVGLFNKSLWGF